MADRPSKEQIVNEFNSFRNQLGDLEFRKMLIKDRLRTLNDVLLKIEEEGKAIQKMKDELKAAADPVVVEAEKADGK
jgi:hypothetical protein